jgi:hypothetical protein
MTPRIRWYDFVRRNIEADGRPRHPAALTMRSLFSLADSAFFDAVVYRSLFFDARE